MVRHPARTIFSAAGAAVALAGGLAAPGPARAAPSLDVPEAVLIDRAFAPRVTGLTPGSRVRVTATTSIRGLRGNTSTWSAEARFIVDADGVLDLAEDSPLTGDYSGARPMGLITAMQAEQPPQAAYFLPQPHRVTFKLHRDGEVVAQAAVSRRYGVQELQSQPLDADRFKATVFTPPGGGPAPGVVVTHGSFANLPETTAKALASRGFTVLAIQYFGRSEVGLPKVLREVPVGYLRDAIDAFAGHEAVAGEAVGLWAPSRGSELIVLAAADNPHVGAIAPAMPSDVAWMGLGPKGDSLESAAWTRDGEPVAYLQTVKGKRIGKDEPPRAFYEIADAEASAETRKAARLPIHQVDAPWFIISGGADALWHSGPMAKRMAADLRSREGAPAVEHAYYPNAGHLIPVPYVPTYGSTHFGWPLGGTPDTQARAAADLWPRVLAFFERHLPGSAQPETVSGTVAPLE